MKQLLGTLVLIFASLAPALARDSTSAHSQSNNGQANIQSAPPSAGVALQMLRQSRTGNHPTNWRLEPGATLRLTPNTLAEGCYTMRIYKVKRSERLQDGDTDSRGYSIFEPGSNFQVRTATAADQPQAK